MDWLGQLMGQLWCFSNIQVIMNNYAPLQHFHDIAYRAISRNELLGAINEFLDESIVLPPGDWDQKTLLPIMDMARRKAKVRRRKREKEKEKQGKKTTIRTLNLTVNHLLFAWPYFRETIAHHLFTTLYFRDSSYLLL